MEKVTWLLFLAYLVWTAEKQTNKQKYIHICILCSDDFYFKTSDEQRFLVNTTITDYLRLEGCHPNQPLA